MSARGESTYRFLRPVVPLAAGVMLAHVAAGVLVIALAVLVRPHLVGFDFALLAASGTALVARGVRDAERDRTILPRESWPTLRSRAIVWGAVVLFASGPLVLGALLIDRFATTAVAVAIAIVVSSAGWGLTCATKLRVNPVWLPRPDDEEAEAGAAIGALLLTATLVAATLLTRIASAFGSGPLPSNLTAGGGMVLSLLATVFAGGAVLVPLTLSRVLRGSSSSAFRAAFAVLAVPLAVLMLMPLQRWGQPLPSFIPAYAAGIGGRVFLSVVLALVVVELARSRRSRGTEEPE